MDVKEESILGEDVGTHWYYVAKGRALRALIGTAPIPEVLDVGAGSGVFSRQLLINGICTAATCVDPAYATERTELVAGRELTFVRGIRHVSQSLILFMDVLEHVDDDAALLRQYTRDMPAGARVVISVPAFNLLWSPHDDFLEHRRRYSKQLLVKAITAAGLETTRIRFFFGLLLPAVAAVRIGRRLLARAAHEPPQSALHRHSPFVNRALVAVHDAERKLVFPLNSFAGLTIFAMARGRAP